MLLPLCPLPQEDFFARVQEAKFSVKGLSTNDLLRKDYKEWVLGKTKCGIGSALIPITDWAQMDDDLASGFAAFSESRQLDMLLSMNAFTNPDFQRNLVISTKDEAELDKLVTHLQEKGLELEPVTIEGQKDTDAMCIKFFVQGNLGISRKKMQPILAEYFED